MPRNQSSSTSNGVCTVLIDSGVVVMLAQVRTTAKSKEAISTMLWLSSFHSERNQPMKVVDSSTKAT